MLTIYESDAKSMDATIAASSKNKFTDISKAGKLTYTQKENDFIDFKREPLIPYKCSRKGPYYAKADINGDKQEEFFYWWRCRHRREANAAKCKRIFYRKETGCVCCCQKPGRHERSFL
ncbi:MAG: hypothetical protein IPI88_08800 [Chitinophagaceae bacterium]|nr:hypothetical protein [Chitinophagaceae bacterium]